MNWFCSGLTLLVFTEAFVLVVFLLFLRRLFTACYIYGYFSTRCWVLHLSRDHYSFPYHLVGLLMSIPFSLWFLFPVPHCLWPSRTPLPWPPLPSKRPPLHPLPSLPDMLTLRLCAYLTDDVWVAGKRRDIKVDEYVEAVLKLAIRIDLHILTPVFKSLFGQFLLSMSCLTSLPSYRGTL